MSSNARASVRRVQSRSLFTLGIAAALVGLVLFILALGSFDQTDYRLVVEAHDLVTGEVRWVIDEGTNESPHFTDELLLYADGSGIVAIDASGEVVWRVDGIGPQLWTAEGDTIYFLAERDEAPPSVVAVDGASGVVMWRAEDRWLVEAGDEYVVLRHGAVDEIVEAPSGTVVHTTENLRSVVIDDGIVAYQVGRTLRVRRPADGSVVEASDRRRRPLAIASPIVVAEHSGSFDDETGRRPWILTGIDSRSGAVQWETTFTRRSQLVSRDGGVLQFVHPGLVITVDAQTGETTETAPSVSADPLRWPRAGPAGDVVVDWFARIDSGQGRVMVLTTRFGGIDDAWVAIAADVETERVLWTMSGARPVAANSEVAVLHVGRSFQVIDSETGSMLLTVPAAKRFARAAATNRWALVVSGDELIAVDGTGQARTVADRLTSSSRIEAAIGDIVVLHARRGEYPSGRRTLTAYDVAAGVPLWEHSSISWRGSVRLAGDTLELVHEDEVTEIALASGEMTQRKTTAGETADESSGHVVAAFDAELSRLLWSVAVESGVRTAVIGDVALTFHVERE